MGMAAVAGGLRASSSSAGACWRPLGMPSRELRLEHTLPTGQSFRWRQTGSEPLEFTGVVGRRVVALRQDSTDVSFRVVARGAGEQTGDDSVILEDYFQKSLCLSKLAHQWAAADQRYRELAPYVTGARMLRQDPLECLFSFICSQNNHISRIHGMVERLASNYGEQLVDAVEGEDEDATPAFYAFPTLERLADVSEEALRADGYGYRAKFIAGTAQALLQKPGGSHQWLQSLREASYQEAIEQLQTLPGIGPKVAACVSLFSLDKSGAIPVDTHVWQLALRYYAPHLNGRSLTPKVHGEVQAAFEGVFGEHCGWAHNALFISELPSIRAKLPEHLRSEPVPATPKAKKAKGTAKAKVKAKAKDTGPTQINTERIIEKVKKEKATTASRTTSKKGAEEAPIGAISGKKRAIQKVTDNRSSADIRSWRRTKKRSES